MRNETFEEFQDLAYQLLTQNRFVGTQGHRKVKTDFMLFLESKNIKFSVEEFYVEKYVPKSSSLWVDGKDIPCVAYVGSPPAEVQALVKREFIEGDIALCPQREERAVIKSAHEKGCKAVITYLGDLDTHYYGNAQDTLIPVVNVKRSDLSLLEDARVKLKVESSKERIRCSNLIFEVGRGPLVYLIAHMDTKPDVFGAIDNGVGFLLLPFIYDELRKDFKIPYRFRFMITDAEEVGLEGAIFHVGNGLRHVFYCINVDSIGWSNPAVIYSDAEGPNGERIMDMFYRHMRDVKMEVDFRMSKGARSDHIPFKKAGVQTLFLSSNPFSIRHTFYDVVDAVDWDKVRMWFDLILSFLRRFHKL